nr:hypothetical protein [Actinopolyspora biskrensis]
MRYNRSVTTELWWDEEDIEHIRTRSIRYPGATDIEPSWTVEAAADSHRVLRDPDPKSRASYIRIIGYSASAESVITVIVDPEDFSGVTAWKTRGADLRDYLENKEAGT